MLRAVSQEIVHIYCVRQSVYGNKEGETPDTNRKLTHEVTLFKNFVFSRLSP